jgi:TonB family protein
MRIRYVALVLLLTSFGAVGSAQNQASSPENDNGRKIVRKTQPAYPEIAKRMNLGGTVRVIAVVAADGNVKSVEPMGGSPVLIKAAQDAVAKWRFAPGGETKEMVELHFTPSPESSGR